MYILIFHSWKLYRNRFRRDNIFH